MNLALLDDESPISPTVNGSHRGNDLVAMGLFVRGAMERRQVSFFEKREPEIGHPSSPLIQRRLSTEEVTDLATECIGEKDNGGKRDVATRVEAQEPTRIPSVHRGGTTFTFCSLRNENIKFVAVSRGAACSTITPAQITRAADHHHHRGDNVALDDPSAGSIYEAQGR
jgi:hypothetical protein